MVLWARSITPTILKMISPYCVQIFLCKKVVCKKLLWCHLKYLALWGYKKQFLTFKSSSLKP